MKIAFFELKKWQEEYIKSRLKRNKLYFFKSVLNKRSLEKAKDVEAIVCFIYSKLDSKILNGLPKLKYIATMSTGFDHVDLEYCKKKGIKVSNVPSYGENTVAEHAFGLILSLSKKIPDAVERTKDDDFSLEGLRGFDLKGKTLGVIGPGRIGQHVIKIAKGFEMNIIASGKGKNLRLAKKLGFKFVSFDYLLEHSDIISLHVPLIPETKYLINMKNIRKVKRGAYLINTARGSLVETDALLYGLDRGILAGAGLDVLEGEKDIKDETELLHGNRGKEDWETFLQNHLILKDKNVIVTPHSAFFTKEALERILDTTLSNVKGFLRGKVRNRV